MPPLILYEIYIYKVRYYEFLQIFQLDRFCHFGVNRVWQTDRRIVLEFSVERWLCCDSHGGLRNIEWPVEYYMNLVLFVYHNVYWIRRWHWKYSQSTHTGLPPANYKLELVSITKRRKNTSMKSIKFGDQIICSEPVLRNSFQDWLLRCYCTQYTGIDGDRIG